MASIGCKTMGKSCLEMASIGFNCYTIDQIRSSKDLTDLYTKFPYNCYNLEWLYRSGDGFNFNSVDGQTIDTVLALGMEH